MYITNTTVIEARIEGAFSTHWIVISFLHACVVQSKIFHLRISSIHSVFIWPITDQMFTAIITSISFAIVSYNVIRKKLNLNQLRYLAYFWILDNIKKNKLKCQKQVMSLPKTMFELLMPKQIAINTVDWSFFYTLA